MTTMAACWAAIVASAQEPFALDPTFQTEIQRQYVNSMMVTDDGLIASGVMLFPSEINPKALVRLLPDGQRDPDFNNGGLGGGKITPWEGRFYVAVGDLVRRVQADGSADPDFISMNTGPYFLSLQGGDYHIFPDGRLLIAGKHDLDDSTRGFVGQYNLIWFSNEGYLDTTRVHRQGNGTNYFVNALPDGRFLCSGTGTIFDGQPVDRFFRTFADGAVDTSFHSGVYLGNVRRVLPMDDGRFYAGGNYWTTQVENDTVRLARFLPNGELDPTFTIPHFATEGDVSASHPAGPFVHFLRPWTDGQLLACGMFSQVNGEERPGICILDSTGTLTPAFSGCRLGPFTYQGSTTALLTDFKVDADSTHYYICGIFAGYTEGEVEHPEQRFISRLHVGDISTGISTPRSVEPQFHIYPNPASEQITFNYDLTTAPKNAALLIRDITGREVARLALVQGQDRTLFDTRTLAIGTYTVGLTNNGQHLRSERLVIQR
ncbi:MAG: T9SS type A sorting domain-containing protein [Bacteroidetes bacterium]|nr:T9SS type A sorting domain-containing protein [Bacteroidota bacterium]